MRAGPEVATSGYRRPRQLQTASGGIEVPVSSIEPQSEGRDDRDGGHEGACAAILAALDAAPVLEPPNMVPVQYR